MPTEPRRVAGGADESVGEPRWSPAGELHFVSDRSGWWNLYRERAGRIDAVHAARTPSSASRTGSSARRCTASRPTAASSASSTRTAARTWRGSTRTATSSASWRRRSARSGTARRRRLRRLPSPPADSEVEAIVRLDLASGTWRVLRRASEIALDPGDVSVAEAIDLPRQRRRARARLLLSAAQPLVHRAEPGRGRRCWS